MFLNLGGVFVWYKPPPFFYLGDDKIKILNLDQATKITGYSLFDNGELITYGTLEAKDKNLMERMKEMQKLIGGLIKKHKPDYVVFESVQFQRNYKTYMQLAQLQGIILAHLFRSKIAFSIVEASAWRKNAAIKGRKRAEQKKNTQKFVKEKYNIDCTEDEADAVGIGCWSNNNINKCAKGE